MIDAAPPVLPAAPEDDGSEEPPFVPYSPRDRYRRLWDRLRPNRALWAGAALLGAMLALAVEAVLRFGDSLDLLPVDPAWSFALVAPGPSWGHWFGTDRSLGVDVLDAVLRATPNDLVLVGGMLVLSAVVGVLLGAWAGLVGGVVDLLVVAASDLLVGVPPFFFVLVLFLGVQPLLPLGGDHLPVFGLLFVVVLWPYYARPVRAIAQRASVTPYAEAARAAGSGNGRLLFRHVLPNALFPAFAQLPVDVYNIFFVLTVFPFLGCLGGGNAAFQPISVVPSPLFPEWGSLLGYGACYGWSLIPELNAWWSYTFPAAFIVLFGLGVMLLCDGLEHHVAVAGPTR